MPIQRVASRSEFNDLFQNKTIIHVRVDDNVTVIPPDAFYRCCSLREVQLPSGLTKIESSCFEECTSLKKLCLPNSIRQIGAQAFESSGLVDMKIPPLVTKIERWAFSGCKSLVHVELHENVTRIGQYSFGRCTSLHTIELPSFLEDIGNHAFVGCGLEQIRLPPHVSLGQTAFEDCEQLSKIIFPHSMGRIETNTFRGCRKICLLQLPTTTTVEEAKFSALEQKLVTEFCRTDGQSAIDRIGMGWIRTNMHYEKDPNSTVQATCLFSFLKQNDHRILINKRQGQGGKRKRA